MAARSVMELVGRVAELSGELHEDARVTWACKAFAQYYSQQYYSQCFTCELARQHGAAVGAVRGRGSSTSRRT